MAAKKPKPVAKKRAARKSLLTNDPAQSARFVEMAKKLEADENGDAFERAVGVLVPPPKEHK